MFLEGKPLGVDLTKTDCLCCNKPAWAEISEAEALRILGDEYTDDSDPVTRCFLDSCLPHWRDVLAEADGFFSGTGDHAIRGLRLGPATTGRLMFKAYKAGHQIIMSVNYDGHFKWFKYPR